MVKVYTYACADLLHIGHLRAFQQAKALGDCLIVGVLTDEAIEAYKRKPIIPFEERLELVASLKCVDQAVRQDDVNPTLNLQRFQPDILVHGDDWTEDFPGADYMRATGKRVMRTKYTPGRCTTQIIGEIQERYEDEKRDRSRQDTAGHSCSGIVA